MQGFTPAFPGLYGDDIVEIDNVPYTEWPSMLAEYPRFRVRRQNQDEVGVEQVFKVREGLILRVIDLQILRDNRALVRTFGGYVSFFFNLSGGFSLVGEEGNEHRHSAGTCGIGYHTDSEVVEDFCRAGIKYTLIQVMISKVLLQTELFGGEWDTMPQVLRPLFRQQLPEMYHTLPIDAEMHQALQILAATDYTGALRDRFFDVKSLELICLVLRALYRQERAVSHKPLGEREVGLLEQARTRLVADLSAPPSVEELAQQMGLAKSTLLERFKKFYGLSLRDYLLQARMDRARDLLAQRDLNIDQVAWQLGYEHACNFVTAFRRRYGLTPNAFRKLGSKR